MDSEAFVFDPVADDPSVYMRPPISPDEHLLVEQIGQGQHDGAQVPFWMFAKLALRVKRQGAWIGRVDSLFRAVRRHARVGLGALAANLIAIASFALHHAAVEGAAREHDAAEERAESEYRRVINHQLEQLDKDIRELRLRLDRLSGIETPAPSSDIWQLPDTVTSAERGPACTVFASHFPWP